MAKRKRVRAPDKLAIELRDPKYRPCVVTARRAKWKETQAPSERVISMLRFIWMRQHLLWKDRHALHGPTFGTALRLGLVESTPLASSARLALTPEGEDWATGKHG